MALTHERELDDNHRNISVEDKNFDDLSPGNKTPSIWNISHDDNDDVFDSNKLSNIQPPSEGKYSSNDKEGIRADIYGDTGGKNGTNRLDSNMAAYSKTKNGGDETIKFTNDKKFDRLDGGGPKGSGNSVRDCCCQEDWVDFTEQTSLHGLRYIWLRHGSIIRRFLWLVLSLLCFGIMMYQICDRGIYYFSWPVTVNVKINFNESLQFPTLTICNQNAFRATAAEASGHYDLISSMFGDVGTFNASELDTLNVTDLSFGDLYGQAGHQPKDMILGCKWKGEECGWWNFSVIATDSGLCYSFNAQPRAGGEGFLTVDNAGSENGLSLTVNVEQYEYMPGPSDAAGVKILLHHPYQFPQVRGLGLVLPAGSFAFVGTSMISVNNLPEPHGQCSSPYLGHFKHYSTEACEVDCKTRLLEDLCGCRLHYMPVGHGTPECTLQQYYQCYIPSSGRLRHLFASTCKCPVPCEFLSYDTSVSQAVTSPLSIDRFLAQTDQSELKARYDAARDVTHRLQREKRQKLNDLIENLDLHFEHVRNLVLTQIEQKIEKQREALTMVAAQVESVHRQTKYLFDYQKYIVDKNYVRARDAMNERTQSVMCMAYQEFSVLVELAINTLLDVNITDESVREVTYRDVARKLDARKDIAERALANYTQFLNALESGQPIFNYKYGREPRANSYLIAPLPLFHDALNHSTMIKKRTQMMGQSLIELAEQMSVLKDIAQRAYSYQELNTTELHVQNVHFLYLCRSFSQSKDIFMNDVPEILASELAARDNRLEIIYDRFNRGRDDFNTQAVSLMAELGHIKSGTLGAIAQALNLARRFLFQGTLSKREVATEFLREDIVKTQSTLKNFFSEVRSRGHAVYDDWIELEKSAIDIWRMALEEKNLHTYYQARNMTHMLVNTEEKARNIREWCRRPRDEHDLRRVVNNVDAQFTEALSDMLEEMASFKETEGIDARFMRENILHLNVFYKELSYEQITQQEAYDVFALLCDIGGSMGLFLGASVITVFEVMDLIVFTYLARLLMPKPKEDRATQVDI